MARYRAPGKVVVSGAYSVLYGAPAIVSAVSRYAVADASRSATFITPEVRAALSSGRPPPWFDASELRHGDRKLGLGSSAAILVASLAAHFDDCSTHFVERQLFPLALRAHRTAQGGGSGVDVVAACFGGTRIVERRGDVPQHELIHIPDELIVEVWASSAQASTSAFIAKVREFEQRVPRMHSQLMTGLVAAAKSAAEAAIDQDGNALIEALARQAELLDELGTAAGIPIVTDGVRALAKLARRESALLLPAGAGGGDVSLYIARTQPSRALLDALSAHAHHRLGLSLGAAGLHREALPSPAPHPV